MFVNINNIGLINTDSINKIEKDKIESTYVLVFYSKPNKLEEVTKYYKHFENIKDRDREYDYIKTHINVL